jgi:hypothetical protein
MAQTFDPREQAERCRRLARHSTDTSLRDSLLELADEMAARAAAQEATGIRGGGEGSDDHGPA